MFMPFVLFVYIPTTPYFFPQMPIFYPSNGYFVNVKYFIRAVVNPFSS